MFILLTVTMSFSANLYTSFCLSGVNTAVNAPLAMVAVRVCGSHMPDTQDPMMERTWGPKCFLAANPHDFRAECDISRTLWSLSCNRKRNNSIENTDSIQYITGLYSIILSHWSDTSLIVIRVYKRIAHNKNNNIIVCKTIIDKK